ncbi:hypothetical protein [Aestuariivirga sp.]|uniref:hypothetical protein n=1 Tax=Aestuariivirga sp. TaxID=2650926 RepID=UPI00391992DA
MSPLGYVLLKLMRGGAAGAALFIVLVIGIELWKHGGDMTAMDPGFAVLLALLLVGAVWLMRAMGRELARHRPDGGS